MRINRRSAAVVMTAALLLTGCSKAKQTGDDPVVSAVTSTSTPAPVSSGTPAPTVSTTAPAPTVSSTPTSAAPSSRPPTVAPSSSAPAPVRSSTAAAAGPAGCPTSALTVQALRASGAAGHQYAFLQFSNKSATACSLTGYPGVQLLAGGKALGKPAVRSGKATRTLTLKPGGTVTAQLTDASTCNADNSDQIQIIVPNHTDTVLLALSLRGCPLTIDPVIPATS